MTTPLYQGHDKPVDPKKELNAHKGLWFERFFNSYNDYWEVQDEAKKQWIETVANQCGNKAQLETYAIAQQQLCESLHGKSKIFKNDWNFVTGIGIDHPVENGMSWHPTLGVPYLSGAAVKGLIRAWIEQWSDLDREALEEKCLKWFGSRSKKPEEQQDDNKAGELIFFDAVPVSPVTLACDIMTPHMDKWYSDGAVIQNDDDKKTQRGNYKDTLPADWHNPIPIPFLVVKQASLQFCIASRTNEAKKELEGVMQTLQTSLEYLGAGAKTAVGYGRFVVDTETENKLQKVQKVVSRASMKPEDRFCDELKDIDEKKLAEMFGRNFNPTKEKYEKEGCDWNEILNLLVKKKRPLIEEWAEANKTTAQGKAYKKLSSFL